MQNSTTKAKIMALFSATAWASVYPGLRFSLQAYTPGSLALLRYLIAAIFMTLIYFLYIPKKKRAVHSKKNVALMMFLGSFGLGIYSVFLNYGEMTVTATIAGFLIGQIPVIAALIAIIFLKERLSPLAWIGFALSVCGIFLLNKSDHGQYSFSLGAMAILFSAFLCAIYMTAQKPLLKTINPLVFTTFAAWGAVLVLSYYSFDLVKEIQAAPLSITLTVVYLGIVPAALAFAAWSYVMQNLPAAKAVGLLYFSPVIAAILSWVTIGEQPDSLIALGGLMAIAGAILIGRSKIQTK